MSPIFANPRDFYSDELYARVCIGVGNAVWYRFSLLYRFCPMVRAVPKDVLKIIARLVEQFEYEDMLGGLMHPPESDNDFSEKQKNTGFV